MEYLMGRRSGMLSILLVATVAVGVTWLYLRCRRKRQRIHPPESMGTQPTAVEETQATVEEKAPLPPAGEPQPIVTTEVEPTAAGETQRFPAEEAQTEVAPEAQPIVLQEVEPTAVAETTPAAVEELQPTLAEETRRTVAEEAQALAVEEVPGKAEGGQPKPIARGGRPRVPAQGHREGSTTRNPVTPKPEVVCWKRERQWILAVEVPEELLENQNLVVLEDKAALMLDDSREGCWRLGKTSGEVIVRLSEAEGARDLRIPLGEEGYLLFELFGRDLSQGRKVKSTSSGSYLVIAPDDWERDESLSGPPPVTPEAVSLDGYQAHFFELEKSSDSKIAFRTPGGQSVVIESKAARFELVGNRLDDASDTMGPLFGGRPPRVRALDDQAWQGVSTIVIGEEGSGRGRWRTQMAPVPDEMEQDLSSGLGARQGGWYFLRLYDTNDDLIESLDFRFLCALNEVRIPQPSPLPTQEGHNWVRVEFLHEPGCVVQPVSSLPDIQIERQDDKTILSIPPDPACDRTRWQVGPEDGTRVEVTILVERLWWALGDEDKEPSKWEDQPLSLLRDDFAATSKKALWLRLPRSRWVDKVAVGFERPKARTYEVKVTEKTVSIPLRDYGDTEEVERVGIAPLNLWISLQQTTYTGTPCELVVKVGCRTCDFITPSEEDMFHHIESMHLDEFFTPLTYEEMRGLVPSLPPKIYLCSYCNFYVKSDDPRNPTSTIIKHIEKECPKTYREMRPCITFRVIDDADEIRGNVISDLPRIHKCKLCAVHLNEASERDMIQHLVEQHNHMLYELR